MSTFYLDASALAKRYVLEVGSHHVDALFARADHRQLAYLTLAVGEAISVIVRRRNRGDITPDDALDAINSLLVEVLQDIRVHKMEMTDDLVTPSFPFIDRYSLNSTDAVLPNAAVVARDVGLSPLMLCSDGRLLRAAGAEGIPAFDPETGTSEDLEELLAG